MIYQIQYYVFLALALVAFAIEVWALVDVARRPAKSFLTAEKRTKVFWAAVIVAGAVFGYLSIPQFNLLGIWFGFGLPTLIMMIAVLPGAIYLADVKPEVVRYSGRGSSGSRW